MKTSTIEREVLSGYKQESRYWHGRQIDERALTLKILRYAEKQSDVTCEVIVAMIEHHLDKDEK